MFELLRYAGETPVWDVITASRLAEGQRMLHAYNLVINLHRCEIVWQRKKLPSVEELGFAFQKGTPGNVKLGQREKLPSTKKLNCRQRKQFDD